MSAGPSSENAQITRAIELVQRWQRETRQARLSPEASAELAKQIAEFAAGEQLGVLRSLWSVVRMAGGSVTVDRRVLEDFGPSATLNTYTTPAGSHVFEAT